VNKYAFLLCTTRSDSIKSQKGMFHTPSVHFCDPWYLHVTLCDPWYLHVTLCNELLNESSAEKFWSNMGHTDLISTKVLDLA
ncbi:hypothetical protein HispidOSU_011874, partial [Sigmodon hispidus]